MIGKDIGPEFGNTQIFKGSQCNLRLCPNCARQGQIFPNSSKRIHNLVEKVVYNQLVVITLFLILKNPGLRIRRPQVRILPGVPIKEKRDRAHNRLHPVFYWIQVGSKPRSRLSDSETRLFR